MDKVSSPKQPISCDKSANVTANSKQAGIAPGTHIVTVCPGYNLVL